MQKKKTSAKVRALKKDFAKVLCNNFFCKGSCNNFFFSKGTYLQIKKTCNKKIKKRFCIQTFNK